MKIDANFVRRTLPKRRPDSHKGENGRVLVTAGSRLYFGSPALVSLAAYRAGADLVYTLVPEYIAPAVASFEPDLMVWGYSGEYLNDSAFELLDDLRRKTDVMVIGNGITKRSGALETVSKLVPAYGKQCVIDADAIQPGGIEAKGMIYTPHVREFERLSGKSVPGNAAARAEEVKKAAKKLDAVILLKGRVDVISDGKRAAFNTTGNAGMTVGGTGDTLAGVLAALVSRGIDAFAAACSAAWINGTAGDYAFKRLGYSLLATDIIAELPNVMRKVQR